MGYNGTFIAAHIFIVLPLFGHTYLNIYEISKYTYLHDNYKIKLGILKYLFPSYKGNRTKKLFLWQMITLTIFILMTIAMVLSLFKSFDTKLIVFIINLFVFVLLAIHSVRVKKKFM